MTAIVVDTWNKILEQLRLQMTQATFDSWVKDTWVISQTDKSLVIGTKSAFAKDWLEHKLFGTINRTVCNVIGPVDNISFVVVEPVDSRKIEHEAAPDQEQEPDDHEPQPKPKEPEPFHIVFARDTDFYNAKMDIGRWLPELQYDSLFWQPYLGTLAYQFYRTLLMHWVKSVRKSGFDMLDASNPANQGWTPPFRLSYRKYTAWLGKNNHRLIPGGEYECHRSDFHRKLGLPLDKCCGAHQHHSWRPGVDTGPNRCYYWREGLLHRLFDEHLLTIEINGAARATVQVWRDLTLLTPKQVGAMSDYLQEEHDRWLENHGKHFNITVQQWSQISAPSLIPFRPLHPRQELAGQPPANPFKMLRSNLSHPTANGKTPINGKSLVEAKANAAM